MDAYIRIIGRPDEELKIGGNVSFFGYEENLRHFTLGHGGYLSPQSYFSVSEKWLGKFEQRGLVL